MNMLTKLIILQNSDIKTANAVEESNKGLDGDETPETVTVKKM